MLRRHSRLSFAGSTHFVTTVTHVRGNWFVCEALCHETLSIFEGYRRKFGVLCFGYVLMPDHLHALHLQPEESAGIPAMLQAFKRLTAARCRPADYPEGPFWRRRYDDVPVPGPKAARTKLTYMLANPLRSGLVGTPEEYLWSSAPHVLKGETCPVTISPLA